MMDVLNLGHVMTPEPVLFTDEDHESLSCSLQLHVLSNTTSVFLMSVACTASDLENLLICFLIEN